MGSHVGVEHLEGAPQEPNGAVREPARAAALDVAGHRRNRPRAASPPRPETTWSADPAMAARPCTQGPHWPAVCPASHRSTFAVSLHPHPSCGTTAITPAPTMPPTPARSLGCKGTVSAVSDSQPGPRVATDQHASRPPGRATGPTDHVADRRPDLDLVHAGVRDRTRHGHEHRAGHLLRPDPSEPGRSEGADQGEVSERLHVLDQRRATSDAADERPRARGRDRRSAVQEMNERTLLARRRSRSAPSPP